LTPEEKLALDADRDLRTVFVYQLSVKASEDDVFNLMSQAGKVRDVRLITDRYTRKCKGFGYVEFYEREVIPKAIALSGTPLRGVPIMVKFSEAEKNIAAQQERLIQTQANSGPLRLYVGNLHSHVSEKNLEEIFSPFGPVDSVNLHKDPATGQPKGFAFVNFRNASEGRMAMDQLNGYEIAGMAIKVGLVNETPAAGGGLGGTDEALDDTEGGGMQLTAQSRAMLMARLQRDPNAVQAPSAPSAPAVPNDGLNHDPGCTIAPMAQCCILLRNMFDPRNERDPDFDQDIKEDVGEECGKYGKVLHIAVDKTSAGFVFVKFDSQQGATAAKSSLENRWFNQKMITASYILEGSYGLRFPESN
jgi:RNA-binding protein 39